MLERMICRRRCQPPGRQPSEMSFSILARGILKRDLENRDKRPGDPAIDRRSGFTNKWKQTLTGSGPSAEGCARSSRSTARGRCRPVRFFGVRVCERSGALEFPLVLADTVFNEHTILSKADGATWMAISAEVLRIAVEELSALAPPDPEDGFRWTPGLALAVTKPKIGHVSSTANVRFHSLSLSVVAAWKRDRTTNQGRLDSRMREGGWGSVSAAVAVQTNSKWTARSHSTLRGVLECANET
jgi:hypothetical protein